MNLIFESYKEPNLNEIDERIAAVCCEPSEQKKSNYKINYQRKKFSILWGILNNIYTATNSSNKFRKNFAKTLYSLVGDLDGIEEANG